MICKIFDIQYLHIERQANSQIKIWRMKKSNQRVFVDRVVHEADWKAQDDPNTTWNKIASCIKRVTKDVFGESRGGALPVRTHHGGMKR